MAVGDGGAQVNGQNPGTILGSFLGLDLLPGPGYAIPPPPDNPWVGPGAPLDEMIAYGFRNPYGFDFDPLTGVVYLADVGSTTWEEVNIGALEQLSGGNYGWDDMEGDLCITGVPGVCESGQLRTASYQYDHQDGRCAIIGGVVYRGAIPSLQGRYLFSDWCSAQIWSLLWDDGLGVVDVAEHTSEFIPDAGEISNISAIQRDGFGELVLLDRHDGELFRVIPMPEPAGGVPLALGGLLLSQLSRRRTRGEARRERCATADAASLR